MIRNYKYAKAHKSLRDNYGVPSFCESKTCEGWCKTFEWCKKFGRRYTSNPEDYLWLCRSCHRKYDLTPKKRRKAMKNLIWYGKLNCWSSLYNKCIDCHKTEFPYKANGWCKKCYNKNMWPFYKKMRTEKNALRLRGEIIKRYNEIK